MSDLKDILKSERVFLIVWIYVIVCLLKAQTNKFKNQLSSNNKLFFQLTLNTNLHYFESVLLVGAIEIWTQ